MPVFLNPMALWGATLALVLAAIYFFRRQSHTVKVSSLMFWSKFRVPADGGRRLTSLQTPLVMLIEMLILLLLVLAAANPGVISGEKFVPLVLILDDSFSMRANDEQSARNTAIKFIHDNIFARGIYRISMVRAGAQPEFIGRHDMSSTEAGMLLENWRCNASSADLKAAIRHVHESLSPGSNIVVVTDAVPEYAPAHGTAWLAFGKPLSNLAVTAANRYAMGDLDRCFFEFSNFASEPARLIAEISLPESSTIIEKIDTTLPPRSQRRVRISLRDCAALVKAEIKNDPVKFDNLAWLLPVRRRPVEVELDIKTENMKRLVKHSVEASGLGVIVASSAEIVFHENVKLSHNHNGIWHFNFHNASQPVLLRGNVAIDKTHPLCLGLPQARAAWAFDSKFAEKGRPLLSLANISLLTFSESADESYNFYFNFSPDFSNLQNTPIWPVLFWNLLNWRQQSNPGPESFNCRSGTQVGVSIPAGNSSLLLVKPNGKTSSLRVSRGRSLFSADEPGLYRLETTDASWFVAVNLSSPHESDLTVCSTSAASNVLDPGDIAKYFADARWWFIVPALLLMVLHHWLIGRKRCDRVH